MPQKLTSTKVSVYIYIYIYIYIYGTQPADGNEL